MQQYALPDPDPLSVLRRRHQQQLLQQRFQQLLLQWLIEARESENPAVCA